MATIRHPTQGYLKAVEWIRSGPKCLLIDGQWLAAKSGKIFDTLNPATEEVLCQVAPTPLT